MELLTINYKKHKNYDSLDIANITKLTYAWHHLDIFGEITQNSSILSLCWKKLQNRLKSILYNERPIPKPRKHLLQNSKYQKAIIIFPKKIDYNHTLNVFLGLSSYRHCLSW